MINQELEPLFAESFPFWDKISDEQKENLLRTSERVAFKKGSTIHDGDRCTGIILIKSGCIRLYISSDEGKEITLYRLFPGDMCMLSASCAFDSLTFDVFVNAEADCECVVVGGCAFAELSENVPSVKIFALETALSRFSDVIWLMEQILFMSFDRRLAIFLLDEISKDGGDTVRLTHEQIARYMGSAREVVSRMIKYFSGEGIVQSVRGGVHILDKARLRKLAQ